MLKESITTSSVGLLLGVAVALGLHAVDDEQIYGLARVDVTAAEVKEDEAAHNVLQVEGRVGQACVRAADVFLPGGQWAEAPEEGAVTGLVAEPGAPCGETHTAAHTALSALRLAAREASATKEAVVSARAEFTEAEAQRGFNFGEVALAVGAGVIVGGIGNIPRLWFGPDDAEVLYRPNAQNVAKSEKIVEEQHGTLVEADHKLVRLGQQAAGTCIANSQVGGAKTRAGTMF